MNIIKQVDKCNELIEDNGTSNERNLYSKN